MTAAAKIRNWAGNVEFRAARVHRPTTLEQLQQIVAAAEAVRVLGTGHSFNRIADTHGDLVLLDAMPAEVKIDAEAGTATIAAGMRLAEISSRLHEAGYALANLPSLPHISLAGAVTTATHGSGHAIQNLAGFVRAIRLVDAAGDVAELTRGIDEDFPAAPVALGALGVVTHITVDVQPTYEIAQYVYPDASVDEVLAQHEDVYKSGYSVSTFTTWQAERAQVWLKLRANPDGSLPEPEQAWHGGTLATHPVHPVPGMPPENCTKQQGIPGPWHERLPHFRPEFTPSNGEELQSEFFVPRALAGQAFEAMRHLGPKIAPVLLTSEIRSVAADDLWLSPAYNRDCFAIHLTWIADRAAVTPALAKIEDALLPLAARPHWGKFFLAGPAAALTTYEKANAFRDLLARRDPTAKFRNEFTARLFPN
jgi:alditol oxidase